jgi:hypothetical protein
MLAGYRWLLSVGVFFLSAWLSAGVWVGWAEEIGKNRDRTWRYLSALSQEELKLIDLSTHIPRHAQFPYLPAEPYPFSPPYTAEEMGFRAMEFSHSPRWSCVHADVVGSIDSWGHLIEQSKVVVLVAYRTPEGLVGEMYHTTPGEVFSTSLAQYTGPPERYGNQNLSSRYRVDKMFTKKADMFVYTPSLRRVRRQPQPRREDRFPNLAFTFDDGFGRDAWEWSWRIIGTDVLYQSVRFPNTRKTITLADSTNTYHEMPTSQVKMMGDDYKFYTPGGGVECYVVEARAREDWLPNYYAPRILYWLDKHYFYPLRLEEYNPEEKLIFIETRIAQMLNPALGEQGYGMVVDVYWDITTDLLTYSVHDGHRVKQWTEEDRRAYFNPDFMRRAWFVDGVKSQSDIKGPDEFYLRPSLDEGKFPEERKIELLPELRARVDAQEAAGHLIFSTERASAD